MVMDIENFSHTILYRVDLTLVLVLLDGDVRISILWGIIELSFLIFSAFILGITLLL